jgi:hypothetical protein
MAENTNQPQQSQPLAQTHEQPKNTQGVPPLDPQAANKPPVFNLSNEYKYGEPAIQKSAKDTSQPKD